MGKKVKRRNGENSFEFELPMAGERRAVKSNAEFCEIYGHPHGSLSQGNSIEWLKSLDAESVDLIFADPPYNINKAEWDRFDSQERYIEWSMQWIRELESPTAIIR